MKLPFVFRLRSRTTDEHRRAYVQSRFDSLKREIRDCRLISRQHCEVQEAQNRHISDLRERNDELSADNARLFNRAEEAVERAEQLRKEFAGDLQLAHTRYDEFVRDTMEKLLAKGTPAAARSSQREQELDPQIQEAIDEWSFGNPGLEDKLTREAWSMVKRGDKPEAIAEKIRAGERPE